MRGGKRPGAGRPKGTVGVKTKIRQEMVKAANDGDLMPLQFMLATLRNEGNTFEQRYKAAVDAAPYLHPRLATTTLEGGEKPIGIEHLISAIDGKTRRLPTESD